MEHDTGPDDHKDQGTRAASSADPFGPQVPPQGVAPTEDRSPASPPTGEAPPSGPSGDRPEPSVRPVEPLRPYRLPPRPPTQPAPSISATSLPATGAPADPVVSQEHSRSPRWPYLLVGFFGALLGALAVTALLFGVGELGDTTTTEAVLPTVTVVERVTTEIVNEPGPGFVSAEAVGRKVIPSIVTVQVGDTVEGDPTPGDSTPGDSTLPLDEGDISVFASGSGVVISAEGHIVTNDHVIDGASAFQVIFQDGSIYSADLLGTDPVTDLAVLQISADGLVPVEFGSTEEIQIGAPAIAIGNPLGQQGGASLTVGVLSAINRQVSFTDNTRLFGMLQTDAPITQGSSGGALVNEEGALIGITTAIGVSDAGAEGIGYATPVEVVRRVVDELLETGTVRHSFLGIEGEDHLTQLADGGTAPDGALIRELLDGDSAAGAAGLLAGDVIVRIDDRDVLTMQDLVLSLRLYRAGATVEFEVLRGNEVVTALVTLGERPDDL